MLVFKNISSSRLNPQRRHDPVGDLLGESEGVDGAVEGAHEKTPVERDRVQ